MENNFKEAAEEQSFKMKRSGFNDMETGLWKLGFLAGCEHAAPKWIDMKERTPEYMDVVLICVWNFGHVVTAQYGGSGNEFSIGDHWYKATHWMPLPSPPSIQKLNPENL
jgi:hypothetical protein